MSHHHRRVRRAVVSAAAVCAMCLGVGLVAAQRMQGVPLWTPDKPGSDNITVVAHVPLGPPLSVSDIDIEQELSRPYAYVGRMVYGYEGDKGVDIIDLSDAASAKVIYRWRIEDQDLHLGTGGMDVKHFKWENAWFQNTLRLRGVDNGRRVCRNQHGCRPEEGREAG